MTTKISILDGSHLTKTDKKIIAYAIDNGIPCAGTKRIKAEVQLVEHTTNEYNVIIRKNGSRIHRCRVKAI